MYKKYLLSGLKKKEKHYVWVIMNENITKTEENENWNVLWDLKIW